MFSWLTELFKPKPVFDKPTEAPQPEDDLTALSEFFSTHRTRLRRSNLQQYITENAIPIRDFNLVEGTAMDDGGANESAKNAFVLGQQRLPQNLFAWFVSHGFIGHQACGLIAQQWLVNKACTMKGRDAVRNGYQISINDGSDVDPEVIAYITKRDKKHKLKRNLEQASKFNEVFGIRHVLFLVNSTDPEYYEKPFNPDGIAPGSYRGMTQIDPYWITPLLDSAAVAEPESHHFYEPTFWVISGKKHHRSHFVILRGPEVSDILKPSYIYGGLPLTQRIMERVYAAERTANEAPQLVMTKRLNVRKMDLAKAVAKQREFEEALTVQAEFRDNYGVLIAGIEEDVEQLETSLADLDEVIMTQYQIVASVANVPATKLLGTSPKGFNATGEHEISTYHEELESIQENDLSPIVERHHVCVMRSEVVPKFNIAPFEIDAEWNPVDAPTAKDQAEVNDFKAKTDLAYLDAGAVDAYEVRDRLINDRDSGYNGIESVERPDQAEAPDSSEPAGAPDESDLVPLEPDRAAGVSAIKSVQDGFDGWFD